MSGLKTKFSSVYLSCYVICVYAIYVGTAVFYAGNHLYFYLHFPSCYFTSHSSLFINFFLFINFSLFIALSLFIVLLSFLLSPKADFFLEGSESDFNSEYQFWFYNSFYGGNPSTFTSIFQGFYWAFITISV